MKKHEPMQKPYSRNDGIKIRLIINVIAAPIRVI